MDNNTEIIGGIKLNFNYWDCECKDNYIHSDNINKCFICNAQKEEQPNSIDSEVKHFIKKITCNFSK